MKLTIVPPLDVHQMTNLQNHLCRVQNLRLLWNGGSVREGTMIAVSAEKPIPLIAVLRKMPPVEQAIRKSEKIQVMLKAA